MAHRIVRLVFTGGPCGGKTTALAHLKQKLAEKGYLVLIVPEAATLCIGGGLSPIDSAIGVEMAQRAIIGTGIDLEKIWNQAAEELAKKYPVVMIHDRGIPDSHAYMPAELYGTVLGENGLHPVAVRDSRYNAVFHLVTAADGAREFYTCANNAARSESAEQALRQDERTIEAWTGTPYLRVINNSTDFAGKLNRLHQEVCQVLDIPVPIQFERKFVVRLDPEKIPQPAQRVSIEQVYLTSAHPSIIRRVRKRGQHGHFSYYYTEIRETGISGQRIKTERIITQGEYERALGSRMLGSIVIQKFRTCFVHEYQYFKYDEFDNLGVTGLGGLLELELTNENMKIEFPSWIRVIDEVTGNPNWSNFNIARRLGYFAR